MSDPIELNAIRDQLDAERRSLVHDGEALQVLPHVTRVRRTDREGHYIAFSSLTAADADSVIAEQVSHYRAINAEAEWKVYGHDSPSDLLDRLARQGFIIGPREAVLVLDLRRRHQWPDNFPVTDAPAHQVVRVSCAAEVSLYRSAAEAIFAKDCQLTAGDITRALESGSTDHLAYVAMKDNQAVSIGRLHTNRHSAFGGLYGGATLPTQRGRGFYRSVVAARAKDAEALGANYLIVDALPTSRPILERLGFQHLSDTWPCELRTTSVRSTRLQ